MASFACPAEKQRRGWGDWEGSSELQRPHEPLEMERGVEVPFSKVGGSLGGSDLE